VKVNLEVTDEEKNEGIVADRQKLAGPYLSDPVTSM
jgi:hypothetical protein